MVCADFRWGVGGTEQQVLTDRLAARGSSLARVPAGANAQPQPPWEHSGSIDADEVSGAVTHRDYSQRV